MKKLEKKSFNAFFSHIYIEKKALPHEHTQRIMEKFKHSKFIEIDNYKDVFSRSHQNFHLQKQTPQLILALKEDNYVYEGAQVCEDFGHQHFYYTSTMMNCIYNCEYCYLQGMYSSANIVVFVNIEDYFSHIASLLKKHPLYLCISYDTDILAFENVLGYGQKWIAFAQKHLNLLIELRTKSANMNALQNVVTPTNVILAWTLSPQYIIEQYEHQTPSLMHRLMSIKKAIEQGWKIRLCFDPLLYVKNWKQYYKELIEQTFHVLDNKQIYDISIGLFRVSKDYLKKMRKQNTKALLLQYPFETTQNIATYDEVLSNEMIQYMYALVSQYISKEKIYV